MAIRLDQLAQLVDGNLVAGDNTSATDSEVTGAATLNLAAPSEISLLDNPEKARLLKDTSALAVVVPRDFTPEGITALQVDDVHAAFAKIVTQFRPQRGSGRQGVSPVAHVSPSAKLAVDVDVHPGAVIGDEVEIGAGSTIHAGVVLMAGCKIAEQVTIFPNAVLYEDTIVGPRCILHAGAVLGAYGFGYDSSSGQHLLSAQLGYVEVGADVEIGAGATIDRGTYGPTTIGDGTKIDNLVMIAHNVQVGKHNMICSESGIAGSSTTGDYVVLAGKVGVRDHVHIGTGAVLGAMAGIVNDVPAGEVYIGVPATPQRDQKLKQAALVKLPEMRKDLKKLRREFDRLSSEVQGDDNSADGSSAAA